MVRPSIWRCVVWPAGSTMDDGVCITAGIGIAPTSTRLCCPAADPDTCTETAQMGFTLDEAEPTDVEIPPELESEADWRTLAFVFVVVAGCCCCSATVAWSHIGYKSCEAKPSIDRSIPQSNLDKRLSLGEKTAAGSQSTQVEGPRANEFDSLLTISDGTAPTKLRRDPPPLTSALVTSLGTPTTGLSREPPAVHSPGSMRAGTPPRSSKTSTPPRRSTPPRTPQQIAMAAMQASSTGSKPARTPRQIAMAAMQASSTDGGYPKRPASPKRRLPV